MSDLEETKPDEGAPSDAQLGEGAVGEGTAGEGTAGEGAPVVPPVAPEGPPTTLGGGKMEEFSPATYGGSGIKESLSHADTLTGGKRRRRKAKKSKKKSKAKKSKGRKTRRRRRGKK